MAREPRKQQQQRSTVAIVGDGQTERIYFSDVRDTYTDGHVITKAHCYSVSQHSSKLHVSGSALPAIC